MVRKIQLGWGREEKKSHSIFTTDPIITAVQTYKPSRHIFNKYRSGGISAYARKMEETIDDLPELPYIVVDDSHVELKGTELHRMDCEDWLIIWTDYQLSVCTYLFNTITGSIYINISTRYVGYLNIRADILNGLYGLARWRQIV